MCFTISLMFLLMTADVDGQQDWGMNYNTSDVCALRGSTVRMSCDLKYPPDHVVNKTFWTKNAVTTEGPNDMCLYRRVQCHSENKDSYSITLTNVTEADKHIYYCRFITDRPDGVWTGVPGVQLDVTDLQVETQQRVKEGDSVTLTCKTTCRLTEETTFIWYRNTQTLTEHTVNEFHLKSVSHHDSGLYRCAVRGSEHLSSPDVYLDIEYPPEKTSVSISSSGVIVEGDSVTLTCSSESNPPVHIYSWFKENHTSSVGSGQTFSISNINSSLSGWFYCVAQNTHGSQRSAAVSLTVKGCGGLSIFICMGLFIKNRRTDNRKQDMNQHQVSEHTSSSSPAVDSASSHESFSADVSLTADSSDDSYTALNPASRTSADIYNTIRVNLSNIHSQTLLHSNSHENKIYSLCFFHSLISAGVLMTST
ncbi:Myelin-associated glycoprotein 1B236 [Triplophysa tibetana]|uniref:Myelin-associated glycoprotein 1B236 n=1 Tax=Triplophysa tibetana TaxID=1572043 RepID=A0A5A9PLE6_9TELE|nr:Myelin-associated glycoprotein 1B236 [Triplophysa tibetana]